MLKRLKKIINGYEKIQNGYEKIQNGIDNYMDKLFKQVTTNNRVHCKIEMLSYHINHRILEERARQKVKEGKKLKVFFLVSYSSKFKVETVYKQMLESDIFDPYIFLVHSRDRSFNTRPDYIAEVKETYEFFLKQGYRTILGYNDDMQPIGLECYNPDIVFMDFPNLHAGCHYKNININYNYLTCYITYAIYILENFPYHFDNYQIYTSWKIFSETYFSYYQTIEKSMFNGLNAVPSGYPKLDNYYLDESENGIKEKKIVIYAPHWSIRTPKHVNNNISTFHIYHQYFLDLLDKYPEIDFYFKPHPDLKYRIRELYDQGIDIGISPDDYENYMTKWEAKDNGHVLLDGTYIPLFKKSDCLITDCASFIAEYLPANHPCIYLLNIENKDPLASYNTFARKILSTYYCCKNEAEIAEAFNENVIEEKDTKKTLRENILKEEYPNLGHSGAYICEYLTKILT